jgi:hypothetical protein
MLRNALLFLFFVLFKHICQIFNLKTSLESWRLTNQELAGNFSQKISMANNMGNTGRQIQCCQLAEISVSKHKSGRVEILVAENSTAEFLQIYQKWHKGAKLF